MSTHFLEDRLLSLNLPVKKESFVSEMIIEINIQEQPKARAGVNFSSVTIIERKILNTDSREKIRAAVVGGVFFCPTA